MQRRGDAVGGHVDDARQIGELLARRQPHRLSIWHRLRLAPCLHIDPLAVDKDGESLPDQRPQPRPTTSQSSRLNHPIRRLDSKLVGDIEGMDHHLERHNATLDPNIHETERSRVRLDRCHGHGQSQQRDQPPHCRQW